MAVSSLVFVIPMFIIISVSIPKVGPDGNPVNFPTFMFLLMPIAYLIFTYISSVIGCFIYNFLVKFIGGFEFDLEETDA